MAENNVYADADELKANVTGCNKHGFTEEL